MAGEQTKYTTSFIPKKPVAPTVSNYKKGSNFMTIIAVAIFLASIIASGGVFLYKITVQRTIDGQIETLKKARAEFDEKFIENATRLNERIIAVKALIDNHQSPSELLSLLEDRTLSTVRFNSLTYIKDDNEKMITIDARGIGLGFQSIVLQSDEFGKTGSLKDVVFSSVQPNDSGLVDFAFRGNVDPNLVLFRKSLETAVNTDNSEPNNNLNN